MIRDGDGDGEIWRFVFHEMVIFPRKLFIGNGLDRVIGVGILGDMGRGGQGLQVAFEGADEER